MEDYKNILWSARFLGTSEVPLWYWLLKVGFIPKGKSMSTADSTTDEKDFYAQVMVEIEAANSHHAIELIMALDGRDRQIEILSRLAGALDHALDIRGASTLDLDRARALVRARERAIELDHNLDVDHAHALQDALDRARALYLNLDRATLINRTIIGCLNMMDKGKLSSHVSAAATASPLTALKSNPGRVIIIALLCILICIAVAWMLLLRAQNGVP